MKKMSISSLLGIFCMFHLFACSSQNEVDKFLLLHHSLEYQLERIVGLAENAFYSERKLVQKKGNSPEGKERIKKLEIIIQKTAEMIDKIEKIKRVLIHKQGGGYTPKSGELLYPSASVSSLSKSFEDLGLQLNTYTAFLNRYFKDANAPLLEKLGNGQKNKSFYAYYFQGSTVAASLAMLSHLQMEVYRYELEAFKRFTHGNC